MKVFSVTRIGVEEHVPNYVGVPDDVTIEYFNAECVRLLPEAAELAISEGEQFGMYVGGTDLALALVTVLCKTHGWEPAEVPEFKFFGSTIMGLNGVRQDDEESVGRAVARRLAEHNEKVRKKDW